MFDYIKTLPEFVLHRAQSFFTVQTRRIIHLQDLYVPERLRTGLTRIRIFNFERSTRLLFCTALFQHDNKFVTVRRFTYDSLQIKRYSIRITTDLKEHLRMLPDRHPQPFWVAIRDRVTLVH